MTHVTVSPKYQVVIPREVRERMGIRPGQKVDVMIFGGTIVLVPVPGAEEARGLLSGVDVPFEREPDRL